MIGTFYNIVKMFRGLTIIKVKSSLQIRSVTQSCPTLCYPMNRSTPGLPVHHQLLEFTETHIHRVSDAKFLKNILTGSNSDHCLHSGHQDKAEIPRIPAMNFSGGDGEPAGREKETVRKE